MSLIGAIVPHAPLLLPTIATGQHVITTGGLRASIPKVRRALEDADHIIVVSSHGKRSGVYLSGKGDLTGFGMSRHAVELAIDEGESVRLAMRWGRSMADAQLDFGIVVPALLGAFPPSPISAVALGEISGPEGSPLADVMADAEDLAGALTDFDGTTAVVFSAHTSAALSPAAPLALDETAATIEREVLGAAKEDVSVFSTRSSDLATSGGACGAAVLAVCGLVFGGRGLDVLEYGSPFGVGYLTAIVT